MAKTHFKSANEYIVSKDTRNENTAFENRPYLARGGSNFSGADCVGGG